MKGEVEMTGPELGLVLGTRVALGLGLGLLVANAFSSAEKRSAVGATLLGAGLFAGGCIGMQVFGRSRPFKIAFGTDKPVSGRRPESEQRVGASNPMGDI
jgi:hypothetical protein